MDEIKEINPKIVRWLESRGINRGNAEHCGIYTGRHQKIGDSFEIVPDVMGEVIVFPYFRKGVIRNEKYRAANKLFYQKPGGQKYFWNADILDEGDLHTGRAALVITEGEIDALSVMESGNPYVVSVPDGAPPPKDQSDESEYSIDPDHDDKYRYIYNDWSALSKIKRIIIATDNDPPGKQLAEELVRRLGRARCSFVSYPDGCKDCNDVLVKCDLATMGEIIARAKPYPVSGIYTYNNLPEEPDLVPVSTGFRLLDDYLKPFYPAFMVITGTAGSGKSTFTNQMVGQLNILHNWRAAIASFEMRIKPFVTDTLKQTYRCAGGDEKSISQWLDENFVFIAPEPTQDDRQFDIDWLIEKAQTAVIRHGIRVLVIDPWNEIEHAVSRGESLTDYTGRAIRSLKRFGREFECLVIVVAHPTKSAANKEAHEVTLYDVSDCYSSDTEVLTRRGWLPFPQITMVDEVSCFNSVTGYLEWHSPNRIIKQEYCGVMAHFEGRSFDLLVTPNHRMVVKANWDEPIGAGDKKGRPVRWAKGVWHLVRPDQLTKAPFLIPVAPGLDEGSEPDLIRLDHGYNPDDFVDFIGWFLAEGHEASSSIAISQGKEPYVSDIRSLLSRMGLDARESLSTAVGVHELATIDTKSFYIRKRATPQIVNWIRENCGKLSFGKKIPEAIYDLSPRLKRRLIEAFIKGDGYFYRDKIRREWIASATTTSSLLRDGLQRLAVECGISCVFGRKTQVEPHHLPSWQLTFVADRKEVGLDLRNGHLKWENYCGDIYCLTVPTGAFMVRRNGRPVVSGNSAHFANKADFGIVVIRHGSSELDLISSICVRKVRYQPISGRPGEVHLTYDRDTRTFGQI